MDPISASLMSTLEADIPDKNVWLLFKVGTYEHMAAMQRGLLYMNSVAYFARLEAEKTEALRGDPEEPLLGRVRGEKQDKYYYQFTLRIGEGANAKSFDISENTTLRVEVPSPENVVIFCFSTLADDSTGKIPGEHNGELRLDPRLLAFGTHIVLIKNASELSRRISHAIQQRQSLYGSRYFQGGFGRVKYVDSTGGVETIGLFRKTKKYEWQQEFRFILGAHQQALNSAGALALEIGDISDITQLISLESFLRSPLKLNRRRVKKVGDEYIEVEEQS